MTGAIRDSVSGAVPAQSGTGTPCAAAVLALCMMLSLGSVGTAGAQTLGGGRAQFTAPAQYGVLTAFRSGLQIAHLGGADATVDFNWDVDVSLDLDFVDVGPVRGNLYGRFETVIGGRQREIDPNQQNFVTDITLSVRLPRGEVAGTFHHVSRHQVDRPDAGSVSWNMVGVSWGDRFRLGDVTIDAGVRAMGTVERAGVDYTSQLEGSVAIAQPLVLGVALIGRAEAVIVPVEREQFSRDRLHGGRLEGGVRWRSGIGASDLFVAWEQRIDASAVRRRTTRWSEFGFRVTAPGS